MAFLFGEFELTLNQMKIHTRFTLIWFLLFCFAYTQSRSQNAKYYKPNAIFFKLNESTSQMEAHRRRGDDDKAESLKRIDKASHTSIINDFKTHFTYCPIYFFYDKDLQSILNRDWDSVVVYDTSFNRSGKKIKVNNVGNFFIAEINYPPSIQYDTARANANPTRVSQLGEDDGSVATHDYSLILYDDSFKLLPKPLMLTNILYRKQGLLFGSEERGYRFSGAQKLDAKLKKHLAD